MLALVVSVEASEVELASDILWSLGVQAIEERAGSSDVELWTSVGDDVEAVSPILSGHLSPWPWKFVEVDEAVADTWRIHSQPVWVDTDLVICPAWIPFDAGPGVTTLRIEPGSTFGLGDHPTTILSMRALRDALGDGATVLDVGCGSGVLAIGACVLGASRATAIDVSPAAVPTTMANAAANDVADRIDASNTPLAQIDGPFDVVVANILASTLIQLAGDLRRVVAASGVLIVSGVLAGRHRHVERALLPFRRTGRATRDGWAALTLAAE